MDKIKYLTNFAGCNQQVSCLALGTVKFGRNTGVKYPNGEGAPLPSDLEISELLDQALALGINLIDTAPAYGTAEERLGKILGPRRQEFFLVSKAGEDYTPETLSSSYDFSREALTSSVERSLARLKTDYLDCLMLHCHAKDYETLTTTDALETLSQLKSAGKIRSTGVSIHSNEAGLYALDYCDSLMVAFNSQFQNHLPVISAALNQKKTILLKKAFMSGHISPDQNVENIQVIMDACPEAIIVAGTTKASRLQDNVTIINLHLVK